MQSLTNSAEIPFVGDSILIALATASDFKTEMKWHYEGHNSKLGAVPASPPTSYIQEHDTDLLTARPLGIVIMKALIPLPENMSGTQTISTL